MSCLFIRKLFLRLKIIKIVSFPQWPWKTEEVLNAIFKMTNTLIKMIKMNIQLLGHTGIYRLHLSLSWRRPLLYRNQSIDLQSIVPNLSTRKQSLVPNLSSRNKTLVILIRNYVQADSKVVCSSPILLDRLLCFNNLICLIIFQQSLFPKKNHRRC